MSALSPLIRLDRMRLLRRQMDSDMRALQEWVGKIQERSEMVRGHVYERRRRCGKAGCRCEEGALHSGRVVTIRREGQSKWLSLEGMPDATEMEDLIERYRRFREARTQIGRISQRLLESTDELGRLRERVL